VSYHENSRSGGGSKQVPVLSFLPFPITWTKQIQKQPSLSFHSFIPVLCPEDWLHAIKVEGIKLAPTDWFHVTFNYPYDFGFFLLTPVLHYPWALSSCLFCLLFRRLLMDTVAEGQLPHMSVKWLINFQRFHVKNKIIHNFKKSLFSFENDLKNSTTFL
jgi:hypothetical protein